MPVLNLLTVVVSTVDPAYLAPHRHMKAVFRRCAQNKTCSLVQNGNPEAAVLFCYFMARSTMVPGGCPGIGLYSDTCPSLRIES
jgi:hypothetical protein